MKSIFEVINDNVVAMSEDLNCMHRKIDEIHAALYGTMEDQEKPSTTGETSVVE